MIAPTRIRNARIIRLGAEYGSLDIEELQRTRYALAKLADRVEEPAVLLDMSETQMIGAAFLGILADFQRRLQRRNRRVVVAGASKDVRRLLNRTKLSDIVEVYEDRVHALRALRQQQRPLGMLRLLNPKLKGILDN